MEKVIQNEIISALIYFFIQLQILFEQYNLWKDKHHSALIANQI